MSKYKLIIFDFDGTVFATHEAIIHCINKTFYKYKKQIPARDAVYKTITMGIGLDETFKLLNRDFVFSSIESKKTNYATENTNNHLESDDEGLVKKWVDTYREFYRHEGEEKSYPFDHVKEVLDNLHSSGKIIIIISNKGKEAITSALEKFELKQYVSLVIGDTKGLKKKPDSMIYDKIIKPTFDEVNKDEILVVGDTSADLLFAKNIGADSCWATYGYGLPEECSKINPTYKISNFPDINSIVIEKPQPKIFG